MLRRVTCLLLTAALAVAALDRRSPVGNEELAEAEADETARAAGRRLTAATKRGESFKRPLGAKGRKVASPIRGRRDGGDNLLIPDTFDARERWPYCRSIGIVRDESSTSSLDGYNWMITAASVLSDRFCIATRGEFNGLLSSRELISCCAQCYEVKHAWEYLADFGIVTGGEFASGEGCQPYPYAPCKHHGDGGRAPCADLGYAPQPKCFRWCTNPRYKRSFVRDHRYAVDHYTVFEDAEYIQREILRRGPVQAGFTVYEDLYNYTSGVYRHVAGDEVGTHSARLLGWGVEEGVPYWLADNTWNADWGERGYFKILRGEDECGIESDVYAGSPAV